MARARNEKDWTPEEDELILWGISAGLSGGQIARMLPHRGRNAIAGRCHRKGFKIPRQGVNPSDKAAKSRARAARWRELHGEMAKEPHHDTDALTPPAGTVALLDLTDGQCRWPSGSAAPYSFCGALVYHGAYCLYHARAAVRPGFRRP